MRGEAGINLERRPSFGVTTRFTSSRRSFRSAFWGVSRHSQSHVAIVDSRSPRHSPYIFLESPATVIPRSSVPESPSNGHSPLTSEASTDTLELSSFSPVTLPPSDRPPSERTHSERSLVLERWRKIRSLNPPSTAQETRTDSRRDGRARQDDKSSSGGGIDVPSSSKDVSRRKALPTKNTKVSAFRKKEEEEEERVRAAKLLQEQRKRRGRRDDDDPEDETAEETMERLFSEVAVEEEEVEEDVEMIEHNGQLYTKEEFYATVVAPSLGGGESVKTKMKVKTRPKLRVRKLSDQAPAKVKVVAAVKPDRLVLSGSLTVQDFADSMQIPAVGVLKALILRGVRVTMNYVMDVETAKKIAADLNITVEEADVAAPSAPAVKASEAMLSDEDLENLVRRPPIVTVMGHVDHGKTTLLDAIRKTRVAAGEAGGITQGVRAHQVEVKTSGEGEAKTVVFLDTPGHEAFTAMRSRGAKVTDVAVLVVAADDGVQPQTIEALKHAQAAKVPIVVAINKMDKEGANPDRVKQELTEYGLMPEDWGGETVMVPLSALTGEGINTLLEMILLVSEVEDLYANPDRPGRGTVIDSMVDSQVGPVASLIVRNGTLKVGDFVVAGAAYGRVRALIGENNKRVKSAGPSTAVAVWGLNDMAPAGVEFDVVANEKEARARTEVAVEKERERKMSARASLNNMAQRVKTGELKQLNIILKADVMGSLEAISTTISQLPQHEVSVRMVYTGAGDITKADIDLASASESVVIGFNARLTPDAKETADQAGVDVRQYDVIYSLLDELQSAMEGLLEPETIEDYIGEAEVRNVFRIGKGAVAGCFVKEGKLTKDCLVRIERDGKMIATVKLTSLKRIKDDVKEVPLGMECGVNADDFDQWKEGDIIKAYSQTIVKRKLSAAAP
eukprot:CAMPEP_0184657832 /NCGR_PEP_ID=MMETSP0308-20130426/21955_1 /TAXON_ID=38269 /ORGANISM="Gloeochaete witrockiana, Strain SAG 46.84" /LENGTH=903 /DNA_ID=CAMNT_0027096147 /DNA_START=298 /DNA_END=3009 /DNA_ORIENTATION=-